VKWERFEYVSIATDGEEKRRLKIVTKHSKAGEMFAYFKTLLDSFPAHQFRAKWQQEQMKRNSIPNDIRNITNIQTLKTKLKTYLFKKYLDNSPLF